MVIITTLILSQVRTSVGKFIGTDVITGSDREKKLFFAHFQSIVRIFKYTCADSLAYSWPLTYIIKALQALEAWASYGVIN